MVNYSEKQQKLARLLLEGPRTLEELREETGIPANELNEELKGMLNLKVIVRDNEDRYKLTSFVEEQLKGFMSVCDRIRLEKLFSVILGRCPYRMMMLALCLKKGRVEQIALTVIGYI